MTVCRPSTQSKVDGRHEAGWVHMLFRGEMPTSGTMPEPLPLPAALVCRDPDMKLGEDWYIVRDANGQALAYVYFENGSHR
jgi:hypothetical protein